MKIFTYGSNMSINRLRRRIQSASKISNWFIAGYKLVCNKVSKDGSSKANILRTESSMDLVWGVIYDIANEQKQDLDDFEGLGKGYNEMILQVTDIENKNYNAQVYVADAKFIKNDLLPYDWYQNFIVKGAQENKLPLEYIKYIQSFRFTADRDLIRRQRNFDIIGD